MSDTIFKEKITEILEGGKVPKSDLLAEIKSVPEFQDMNMAYIKYLLCDMMLDRTVMMRVVEEGNSSGEYFELVG